jgi:hypothetical protein
MVERQLFEQQSGVCAEVQKIKTAFLCDGDRIEIDFNFSDGRLDHQFRNADGTDVNRIRQVFQCGSLRIAQLEWLGQGSNKDMGIDDNVHCLFP